MFPTQSSSSCTFSFFSRYQYHHQKEGGFAHFFRVVQREREKERKRERKSKREKARERERERERKREKES